MKKSLPPEAGRRTVLLVEFFSRGGVMHYSLQLARALAGEAAPDVSITLLTARHAEAAAPVGVRLLPWLATWNPHRAPRYLPRRLVRAARGLRYVWVWMQVLAAVRREQPAFILMTDLEHRCDGWFARKLRRWCRRQQPPVPLADIWHNVEAFERHQKGKLQRQLHWRIRLAQVFDTVFVHGTTLQAQFTELTGRGACAIPHGNLAWMAEQAGPDPGLNQRLRLAPQQPLALLFGSLSAYKGVEVLLAAMAALTAASRPLLLIAGMPTAVSQLQRWHDYVRQQGLEPWVRWDTRYIPLPEVAWYFRRADWVVLPYRAIAQSGVAHAALTFGRPLLVTAVGGLPELIDGNGILVPANDPAALAQAMERMAAAPQLREQWGRRSLELAYSRHAWGPIAHTVLAAAAPQLLPHPPTIPVETRNDPAGAAVHSCASTPERVRGDAHGLYL
ncbi:MAG: glycosyltransferase [Acidobacteria bacterium]|nr:MAG: glycosyltransferase [Acidobacteriota bacterium]